MWNAPETGTFSIAKCTISKLPAILQSDLGEVPQGFFEINECFPRSIICAEIFLLALM